MTAILYLITTVIFLVSVKRDSQKTWDALFLTWKKLCALGPIFLIFIIVLSLCLYLIPDHLIVKYLVNTDKSASFFSALFLGSIVFMPGFVVFPLGGILLKKGISYTIISVFTTSLMMVGILTFPIEKEYIGTRAALVRNLAGIVMSVLTALATGLFFGEQLWL